MKDLQVGDRVLTGERTYEAVYAFAHYHPTKRAEFLHISTQPKATIEITEQHMVFLAGEKHPVRADSIRVGDILRGDKEGLTVATIKRVQRQGVYAPLTPKGTVVVSGIVASSYISFQEGKDAMDFGALQVSQHIYVHTALSPFRIVCMGSPSSSTTRSFCHSFDDHGMPRYVAFGIRFNRWILKQNPVVQSTLWLGVLVITAACRVLETVLGSSVLFFGVLLVSGLLSRSSLAARRFERHSIAFFGSEYFQDLNKID